MVRFIINALVVRYAKNIFIYIPLWLDLLCSRFIRSGLARIYLHSTMVRFIIRTNEQDLQIIYAIYIPLWLDLLSIFNFFTNIAKSEFTFHYG